MQTTTEFWCCIQCLKTSLKEISFCIKNIRYHIDKITALYFIMYGTIRKPNSIEEGNTQNNMQQTDLKFC